MNSLDGVIKLETIIGYKFKNVSLAKTAILHPGLKHGNKASIKNFERLEFLGDRVLGLSLSNIFYKKFPTYDDGDLSVKTAALAGTNFLVSLAKKKEIIKCFSVPKDFFVSVNKTSSSIADMLESVFGAIFLDSDFETTNKIIQKLMEDDIDNAPYIKKDSKSILQEIAQAKNLKLPVYRLVKITGETHDPIFKMEATACGISALGYGNSKKSAEHDAASNLIKKLEALS